MAARAIEPPNRRRLLDRRHSGTVSTVASPASVVPRSRLFGIAAAGFAAGPIRRANRAAVPSELVASRIRSAAAFGGVVSESVKVRVPPGSVVASPATAAAISSCGPPSTRNASFCGRGLPLRYPRHRALRGTQGAVKSGPCRRTVRSRSPGPQRIPRAPRRPPPPIADAPWHKSLDLPAVLQDAHGSVDARRLAGSPSRAVDSDRSVLTFAPANRVVGARRVPAWPVQFALARGWRSRTPTCAPRMIHWGPLSQLPLCSHATEQYGSRAAERRLRVDGRSQTRSRSGASRERKSRSPRWPGPKRERQRHPRASGRGTRENVSAAPRTRRVAIAVRSVDRPSPSAAWLRLGRPPRPVPSTPGRRRPPSACSRGARRGRPGRRGGRASSAAASKQRRKRSPRSVMSPLPACMRRTSVWSPPQDCEYVGGPPITSAQYAASRSTCCGCWSSCENGWLSSGSARQRAWCAVASARNAGSPPANSNSVGRTRKPEGRLDAVVRVVHRCRVVARRLFGAALLGLARLDRRRHAGQLELQLPAVLHGQLVRLGRQWLAWNRAHGREGTRRPQRALKNPRAMASRTTRRPTKRWLSADLSRTVRAVRILPLALLALAVLAVAPAAHAATVGIDRQVRQSRPASSRPAAARSPSRPRPARSTTSPPTRPRPARSSSTTPEHR